MTALGVEAAYQLWSATYDSGLNPLLALERRVLLERLVITPKTCFLDLATGTGRWLEYALHHGARGFGVDLSREMLAVAAQKGMNGRLVQGNLKALPFRSGSIDLAVCGFALGYLPSPQPAFREMARVSRRVIASDLHPDAIRAGWARSFHANGQSYEIASHHHSRSFLNACARAAGFRSTWQLEACFGEPERAIFEQAGKGAAFEAARQVPAVLISCWTRP